jgi:hypothetical protein
MFLSALSERMDRLASPSLPSFFYSIFCLHSFFMKGSCDSLSSQPFVSGSPMVPLLFIGVGEAVIITIATVFICLALSDKSDKSTYGLYVHRVGT